jgi:hypothetical protein
MELKRFNDMFFEMLHLYQKEISILTTKTTEMDCGPDGVSSEKSVIIDDKNYFEVHKLGMLALCNNASIKYKDSYNLFMDFYTKNASTVSPCFRTISEIYRMIDNASIEEKEKNRYARIMNAQLTGSEVFFLRYYAESPMGDDMKHLFVKYTTLDNLAFSDLINTRILNFKSVDKNKEGIDFLFYHIRRYLRENLDGKPRKYTSQYPQKFKFILEINIVDSSEFSLILLEDNSKLIVRELSFFENLSSEDDKNFLLLIIHELVSYSNFGLLNNPDDIVITSNIGGPQYQRPIILCSVHCKNKKGDTIKI